MRVDSNLSGCWCDWLLPGLKTDLPVFLMKSTEAGEARIIFPCTFFRPSIFRRPFWTRFSWWGEVKWNCPFSWINYILSGVSAYREATVKQIKNNSKLVNELITVRLLIIIRGFIVCLVLYLESFLMHYECLAFLFLISLCGPGLGKVVDVIRLKAIFVLGQPKFRTGIWRNHNRVIFVIIRNQGRAQSRKLKAEFSKTGMLFF